MILSGNTWYMRINNRLFPVCIFPVLLLSCKTPPGDPGHPRQNIIYPPGASAVVDMTEPPYNLDNTGKTDCSDAIIRAMDDMLTPTRDRQRLIEEVVKRHPDTVIGFEINPRVGVIFPDRLESSKILYFPDGVYRITKTIEYTIGDLQNTRGAELNRQIHFQGQSESGTVFKLDDHHPGFQEGNEVPVISFMKGKHSNVAMSNSFENITIDIGAGNPGAVGLHFYANNTGAVRHVTIRSSDSNRLGAIGLAVLKGPVSGCLIKDLTVEGFDYGIKVIDFSIFTVFEHIHLHHQRKTGFWLVDNVVSIRGLESLNAVPALQMTGEHGMVCILDGDLKGLDHSRPALVFEGGYGYARNIKTTGYATPLISYKGDRVAEDHIDEFYTHPPCSLFDTGRLYSLNLPVEETPLPAWEENFNEWADVSDFGALADGRSDATTAIQKAMNSGKRVVYFQPGKYLIDSTITIPSTVDRVQFMYTDLIAGEQLRKMAYKGAFKITGESEDPILMEDLFAWEKWNGAHFLVEHASTRTLILSDIHTQVGSQYINTVKGGKVFIENVCTTDEHPKKRCFIFDGQKVWARQINPERSDPEVVIGNSNVWILGFKTEARGTSFQLKQGARVEIFGGVVNHFSPGKPIVELTDSDLACICATRGSRELDYIVTETRNGVVRHLMYGELPHRAYPTVYIPLFVSQKSNDAGTTQFQ